jgi:hypothetical protein
MGNSFAVQASQELCSMELLGNHEMQFIYTVLVLCQKLSITTDVDQNAARLHNSEQHKLFSSGL